MGCCYERRRPHGADVIELVEIEQLKRLSDACGCWIYFDADIEETAVPLKVWQRIYSEKIIEMPDILKS